MYEKHTWDKEVKRIQQLNVYSKKEREFMRYFFRGASVVVLDSADRILLTRRQMEFAGIHKEVILTPLNDRIEIWSPVEYNAIVDQEPSDLSELADEVLGKPGGENRTDD